MTAIVHLPQLEPREIIPGYRARFVHSENMTLIYWDIEAGAALPEHKHPHEQVTSVIEGEFELTVDGGAHDLNAGSVAVLPSKIPHSGRAITACRIIDAFYPVREEYR